MLFKSEKRRRHPGMKLAVGALAMVGAVSLVNSAKRTVKEKSKKIIGMFRSSDCSEQSMN